MRPTISSLLEEKGYDIHAVSMHDSVFYAIRKMAKADIGALLVIEKDRLVGVFSERDYTRKIVLRGKSSKDTSVEEVMSRDVVTIEKGTSIDDAMALMTENRVRHLPVFDGDRLIGVVSIGDVVKAVIMNQEYIIKQLKDGWPEKSMTA
ncbi:MAG: CBS domain-containing protein [Verrucomicrobiota bacterium]|mgnify:CR=1 FL=1|nr:CBS domain-containing protein [Verrucomicrobiota bacterium]HCF94561.1 histidine kinase [Verrucomicrobiota bacterium]